jgi:hypothetical protein
MSRYAAVGILLPHHSPKPFLEEPGMNQEQSITTGGGEGEEERALSKLFAVMKREEEEAIKEGRKEGRKIFSPSTSTTTFHIDERISP